MTGNLRDQRSKSSLCHIEAGLTNGDLREHRSTSRSTGNPECITFNDRRNQGEDVALAETTIPMPKAIPSLNKARGSSFLNFMKPLFRLIYMVAVLLCLLSSIAMADTGVLLGKVTDIQDKPIARVTISLIRYGESKQTVTAVTGSSGQFRADGLALGEWIVECTAKGYYDNSAGTGGPMPAFRPTTVVIEHGERKFITLVMKRNAILLGHVTDANGYLITNRSVWLVAAPNMHFGAFHPQVRCDASGFFELEYGLAREPGFGVHVPGKSGYGPFIEFKLEDGKRTRVDFRIVRGSILSGRVLAADGKTPVAGAIVSTTKPNWVVYFPFRAWVQNDPPHESFGDSRFPQVPAPISAKNDALHVEWQAPVKTNSSGYFEFPVNPDVEYTLHADSNPRMSDYENDPKVKLHDGERRTGVIILLKASL